MFIDSNKQICLNIVVVLCLVSIIIYLLKQNNQIEQMTNTDDESIHNAVKKVYDIDVAAIRNLSDIAAELRNGKDVTVPGNLKVTGSIITSSIKNEKEAVQLTLTDGGFLDLIKGNIHIMNGKIFNNSHQLLPPGTIVAWKGTTPPGGWALCDGNDGRPNLKGRFILGYGSGKGSSLNSTGGSETHTLTSNEMPSHSHYQGSRVKCTGQNCQRAGGGGGWSNVGHTSVNGGSKPHNNMPPYYVLAYIIKL